MSTLLPVPGLCCQLHRARAHNCRVPTLSSAWNPLFRTYECSKNHFLNERILLRFMQLMTLNLTHLPDTSSKLYELANSLFLCNRKQCWYAPGTIFHPSLCQSPLHWHTLTYIPLPLNRPLASRPAIFYSSALAHSAPMPSGPSLRAAKRCESSSSMSFLSPSTKMLTIYFKMEGN